MPHAGHTVGLLSIFAEETLTGSGRGWSKKKCAPTQAFQVQCIVSSPSVEKPAVFGWPCTNFVWASFSLLNVTAFDS